MLFVLISDHGISMYTIINTSIQCIFLPEHIDGFELLSRRKQIERVGMGIHVSLIRNLNKKGVGYGYV